MKERKEFFTIASLARDDIERLQGFNAKELTDDEMQNIADKMGDILTAADFYWDILDSILDTFRK